MWMPFLTRVFPYIVFMLSLAMGLVALHNHAVNKGRKQIEGEWAIAREIQLADQINREKEARAKEQSLLDVVNMIEVEKNHEKAAANARYATVIAELRDRNETRASTIGGVSENSSVETGCTGAGLAGPDARFLAGYAADAKRLSIALTQCVQSYQEVHETFGPSKQNQQDQ